MTRRGITLFLCLAMAALLPHGPARAEAVAPPFLKGERLSFIIYWSFIPAAEATLEVAAEEDTPPGAAYHFIMQAKTLSAIDLIYKFRERVDSYVAANVQHSLLYKKVQDSGHPRDIVVRFDWDKHTAHYSNFGQATEPIPIQPGTVDPLSAFYYIRQHLDRQRADLEQWVTDGRKLSTGKAVVIGREELIINGKTYQTIKIEPDLRDVKGVFEKSPGAKMFIWLTDDERKLLVKLKSKVVVGSFVAELNEDDSVLPGSPPPDKTMSKAAD